jgi:hypothetical protein
MNYKGDGSSHGGEISVVKEFNLHCVVTRVADNYLLDSETCIRLQRDPTTAQKS